MSEKVVVIYVSREFRNKIKAEKHELTYEQYFKNLIKKNPESLNLIQSGSQDSKSSKKGGSNVP